MRDGSGARAGSNMRNAPIGLASVAGAVRVIATTSASARDRIAQAMPGVAVLAGRPDYDWSQVPAPGRKLVVTDPDIGQSLYAAGAERVAVAALDAVLDACAAPEADRLARIGDACALLERVVPEDAANDDEPMTALAAAPADPRPPTTPAERRARPAKRGAARGRIDVAALSSDRPVIRVIDGELSRVVDDIERALIASKAPLFQRGDFLVRPAFVEVRAAGGAPFMTSRLIPVNDLTVAELVGAVANIEKFDVRSHDFVPTDCPERVAKTYLARRGAWKLRRLTGIINAPTLRPDGSIIDRPGYDEETGLLFEPHGAEFPPILDHPIQGDAADALKLLTDLVATFPFVADADRSVALSAILTAAVRASLPTAPLHAFTAPTAGSGKSMLADIAAMIATGRRIPVIAQGKTEEEAEKRLGAALLAGDVVISIDNVERSLGGEFLCQVLTQPMVKTRVLGKSINAEVPSNAAIFATGNNLTLVGDMTRRALLCTLDPQVERPELRVFASNPLDDVAADRGRYVVAALTVLRAFHVAGRPRQSEPLGSFEEWSRWVRDGLLWLDERDPVETMEKIRSADPQLEALITVIDQWAAVIGGARVTAREVIEAATMDTTETLPPYRKAFVNADFREALLVVAGDGGAINSRRLGKWLTTNAGRIVGGRKLMADGGRAGVAKWRLFDGCDRE